MLKYSITGTISTKSIVLKKAMNVKLSRNHESSLDSEKMRVFNTRVYFRKKGTGSATLKRTLYF